MHRVLITALVFLAAAASNAAAGRILGDIRLDGKPLAEGVRVRIALAPAGGDKGKAASAVLDSAVTDKFGAYKLSVKPEGKCVLTVVYDKQSPTIEVFSYSEATRYDLILEKKDGKLSLRRK